MAVFAGYFDGSGTLDDPQCKTLTVAGFVAPQEQWAAFEQEWQSILDSEGVGCLHMNEFAHSTGNFKEWRGDENRRRGFLGQLADAIGRHVEKEFTITVKLDAYRMVDSVYMLSEFFRGCPLVRRK